MKDDTLCEPEHCDTSINHYSGNKNEIYIYRRNYVICKIPRNENKIIYKRLSSINNDELLIFLLNIPFGYKNIFEKDLICFHGASFQYKNNAIMLSGFSGAGKSTMLYEMLKNGCSMISEDVCKVSLQKKQHLISNSFPVLKIEKDCKDDRFIEYKIHNNTDNRNRKFYKINNISISNISMNRLTDIVLLKEGKKFKVNDVNHSKKFVKLLPHIFKIPISESLSPIFKDDQIMENIFNNLSKILNNVNIYEVEKNNNEKSEYNAKMILDLIK